MNRKTLATLALLAFAPFAHAGDVSCKVNEMTDKRSCSAEAVMGADSFYFASTKDNGNGLGLIINQRGYLSRPLNSAVYIRINGAPAIKLAAVPMGTDVSCHGRGSCRWNGSALITPTAEQWTALSTASEVKVALGNDATPDSVVTTLDPAVLARWLAEFAAEGVRP